MDTPSVVVKISFNTMGRLAQIVKDFYLGCEMNMLRVGVVGVRLAVVQMSGPE